MKIITATAARNIATDFMNNANRVYVEHVMEEILSAAQKGQRSFYWLYPHTKWTTDITTSFSIFFQGLGYTVDVYPSAMIFKW